ncbi:hypothetical protein F511_13403 [Dorcoceras hygrometricum]|uniref:Uncharacterized protein n=1 Tax=Dorcoceras hygrometricum TaxID=472368 RepID=A0A2Z7BVE5_9LAMI|nr:hypothetical protein F511_13403 [Dorcoceras hygrometricum]
MLNSLSSISVRESRIQYLCDPQWFRDTASRGPTTIVAPESQFRTCPSDHDSIGYHRMSASGESSTTMHRLLHASGPHPIPPANDPNFEFKSLSASDYFWINAKLWTCDHPARIFLYQLGSIETDRVPPAYRFFLISIYGGLLELVQPLIETARISQLTSQLVLQLVAQLSSSYCASDLICTRSLFLYSASHSITALDLIYA